MPVGLRMTEEDLRAYHKRRQSHGDANDSGPGSNVEQRAVHEPEAAHAVQTALQTVDIRFTHYRRRLADPDNFCTKFFVDGLVEAGLLLDDSPQYVNEVRHRQVKIESWQEEYFDIELLPTIEGTNS